jgi:catechol 2,3-dioxygenase-like lactoylglutathione lyase family enzyme
MNDRPAPTVRADAIAHVAFERRDVATMARFLDDFGFLPSRVDGERGRYFRGYGDTPYLVKLVPSARDTFAGFALVARQARDLETIADAEGKVVGSVDGPGGGRYVRLVDPDGNYVDLIHGFTPERSVATRTSPPRLNTPTRKDRVNEPIRTALEPAPVFRIGHVVMMTPSFSAMAQWYTGRFGLIPSDVLTLPDGTPVLGFFRFDRGAEAADHHSIAILAGPAARLLHVATETLDIEAVGQGQQFLRARGWSHYWGIGRHLLGSQIFDYWKDPVGDEWEHYADGDLVTADSPTGHHEFDRGGLWTWGDDLPDSMRPQSDLPTDAPAHARAIHEALSKPPRRWLR